jgi:hypothetical protein
MNSKDQQIRFFAALTFIVKLNTDAWVLPVVVSRFALTPLQKITGRGRCSSFAPDSHRLADPMHGDFRGCLGGEEAMLDFGCLFHAICYIMGALYRTYQMPRPWLCAGLRQRLSKKLERRIQIR